MKPSAWLDSDGFAWTEEGIKCRTVQDNYTPLFKKPDMPLDAQLLAMLTTLPQFSHIESPLLIEFARAVETLHGIKETEAGCRFCGYLICGNCWPPKVQK